MKLFLKQNTQTLMYCFLTVLLLGCYYPLLLNDPITTYDDTLILGGVKNLHSLHEYAERFMSGKVLDIQPVRDLSYIIDFKIKNLIPFHSFHLTNLLLWLGICFFFKSILDVIDDERDQHQWLIWSLVFIYAVSPVFSSSIAWIAGRKHLLSTFFTIWATWLFLKKKDKALRNSSVIEISTLYLLSVLSQPINVLWPLFVFAFSYVEKKTKERGTLLRILAIIAFIFIAINFYYYGTIYERVTAGDGKYDSNFGPGLSLLALGRYFYLTFFPFDSLPVSHYQGSWENMIGMVAMIASLFWLYKRRVGAAVIACFVLYFFLPLIPVTYKVTRIFCSDTYILNASIGLYTAFFLIFKNNKFKYFAALIFSYAFILFCLNVSYVRIFENTDSIFSYAYSKEPTPMSITNTADYLIRNNKFSEAKVRIEQLEIMEPDSRYLSKLKSDVIYLDSQTGDEYKIKSLELIKPKSPLVFLRLALLYSNNNNSTAFLANIEKLLSDPQAYIHHSYLRNEEVVALIRIGCEKNKVAAVCKKKYEAFGKLVTLNDWKPELYKTYYLGFLRHPENLFYN